MENEILEGNKLIAEFMGVVYDKTFPCMSVWIEGDGEDATYFYCEWHPEYKLEGTNIIAWKFSPHDTWCQLMPVIEKIEKDISKDPYYGFTVRIADRCCLIACHQKNKQDGVIYQTPWGFRPLLKIDAVYKAVVEFIKWYNQK
jgi:hypothetical protein